MVLVNKISTGDFWNAAGQMNPSSQGSSLGLSILVRGGSSIVDAALGN